MSFSFGNQVITDGLALYLDAANRSSYPGSGNIWYDLSRNKNDLTLSGSTPPSYTTTGNGSFYFNGVSSYAFIPTNTTLRITTPTIIVACTTGSGTIVTRALAGSFVNYGITSVITTGFSSAQQTCPTDITGLSPTTAPINLYGTVYTGTSVDFYRNGSYVGNNATCYSPLNLAGGVLSVGAVIRISYESFFTGNIAIVMVYNRQLSSDEMIQTQNALKGRFGI